MGFFARMSKRTAVIGSVSAVALAGGIAYAAWTVNSTGSASAQAGQSQSVTFAAGTTTGTLYPNNTAVNVTADATNPNPFAVSFTIPNTAVVTSNIAACDTSTVTFTGATITVAASAVGTPVTVGTLKMPGATADNDCQGAVFSVAVTAGGTSA